jgi:putative ABC transport system ATP-binding protein
VNATPLEPEDATPAIHVDGLCKAYRRGGTTTPVLQDLSLEVARGECAFLAGPSGSGKSTLLSILGCILSPDQGKVRIFEHQIAQQSAKQRAALRLKEIGFVFQRYHLIRGLSALANTIVPQTLMDVPAGQARLRANQLLETLGLGERIHSLPNNLSAGQCQRVALARALINDPRLILADEPTAALDAENGQLVMQLLRGLATEHGKTVVVVTHDSRVFHYADTIHWIDEGRIVRREQPQPPTPSLARASPGAVAVAWPSCGWTPGASPAATSDG